MSTNEDDLVCSVLCDRFRAPINIRRTMTREELQRAAGVSLITSGVGTRIATR